MGSWEVTLSDERSQAMARRFRETLRAHTSDDQSRKWWRLPRPNTRGRWVFAIAATCAAVVIVGGVRHVQTRSAGRARTTGGAESLAMNIAPPVATEHGTEVADASHRLAAMHMNQAMNVLMTESDVQPVSVAPPPDDVQLALRDLLTEAGAFEHEERNGNT